ncbi:hypothetical protein B0H11DRAFT_2025108, partial [Mycena galericulata]
MLAIFFIDAATCVFAFLLCFYYCSPFVVLHTLPHPSFPLPSRTPTPSAAAPRLVRFTFPPRFILSLATHAPLPRIPLAYLFLRTSVPRTLVLWVRARLQYDLFKCLFIPRSAQLHTVWPRHSEARIDSCAHISTRSSMTT